MKSTRELEEAELRLPAPREKEGLQGMASVADALGFGYDEE